MHPEYARHKKPDTKHNNNARRIPGESARSADSDEKDSLYFHGKLSFQPTPWHFASF